MKDESTTPEPQGESEQQPAAPVKPITLRTFVGGISKLVALGALTHFGLLVGKSMAGPNDDDCPYGHPQNDGDICKPSDGNTDVCIDGSPQSDSCTEGDPKDDCLNIKSEDVCNLGQSPEDQCASNGSTSDGDVCLGGGGTTSGSEQDACSPPGSGLAGGDQCKPDGGTWWGGGHDKCQEGGVFSEDICSTISDDTCYNGGSGPGGPGDGGGGYDMCWPILTDTDACYDGTDTQDRCINNGDDGGDDVCCGSTTDDCRKVPLDPDECPSGVAAYDECPGGVGDSDQCPGGEPENDVCEKSGSGRDSADVPDGGSRG